MSVPDRKRVFAQCGALLVAAFAPFVALTYFPDLHLGWLVGALAVLGVIVLVFGVLRLTPGKRWGYPLAAFAGAALFWAALGPVLRSAVAALPRLACSSNVKELANGMVMYAADYDDHFPLASSWHTSLMPYVKKEFHCPYASSAWSYAMNGSMSEVDEKAIEAPDLRVLLFEAEAALTNASGGREWLAPRHRTDRIARANIGFADGHVKSFSAESAARLAW